LGLNQERDIDKPFRIQKAVKPDFIIEHAYWKLQIRDNTPIAMSSQSKFNPLERREWQSKGDRITHNVRLDLLRWGCRSYPEAEERFRRAVEK